MLAPATYKSLSPTKGQPASLGNQNVQLFSKKAGVTMRLLNIGTKAVMLNQI
jgi:hypothetical protein